MHFSDLKITQSTVFLKTCLLQTTNNSGVCTISKNSDVSKIQTTESLPLGHNDTVLPALLNTRPITKSFGSVLVLVGVLCL